jgi:hypothetical protein
MANLYLHTPQSSSNNDGNDSSSGMSVDQESCSMVEQIVGGASNYVAWLVGGWVVMRESSNKIATK